MEEAVVELTTEVRTLAQHVEVLRIAVDDLRAEVEFAVRNIARPAWAPTQPLTSVARDPLSEDFAVNRNDSTGLPADKPATSPEPNVSAQQAGPRRSEDTIIAPAKPKLGSRKKGRLDLKLYFESAYADLVRFIGYGGKPLKEVQIFVRELEKKHGRDKVKEVGDAVAVIDGRNEPYTVRLKDDVRKLAAQMLGRPPEADVRSDHDA